MHVTGVECVNCMCDWGKGLPGTCVCSWRKGCPGMCVIGGKAALICVCSWRKGFPGMCSWEKGYPLGMCSWEKGSTHVTGPGLLCVVGVMGAYVVRPSLFSRINLPSDVEGFETKTYGL